MRTTTGYSQWFNDECARAARAGFASMVLNPAPHYLYHRTLSLVIAPDKPAPDYQLATHECVPSNRDMPGLTAWVHDRSTRLPILPTE